MSELSQSIHGMTVAARVMVTVEHHEIEVVADQAVLQVLGARGETSEHDQKKWLKSTAERFIETNLLLGFDVKALTRILIAGQKPTDAKDLVQPNAPLWASLRTGYQPLGIQVCGCNEHCLCCYCIPL